MPRYITDTVAGFQNTERQNAECPELQNSRAHPPTAPPPKGGQGESQIQFLYLLYSRAVVESGERGSFPHSPSDTVYSGLSAKSFSSVCILLHSSFTAVSILSPRNLMKVIV